jgi:hypothetical protein
VKNVTLLVLAGLCVVFAVVLSGCEEIGVMKWFNKEGPTDKDIARAYHLTELRRSTAADVLPMIYMPDYSLLSQSAKVLAAQGEMQKGNKTWLTMISFDENDLLAKRKYLMFVYDKPDQWFPVPSAGFRFDCQLVLEGEILEEPYADENTRQIAMMKFARQTVHDDIIEVKEDNKAFEISGAMINQSLEAVLQVLDESPALAAKLSDDAGLDFQHHSFDRGKIQMTSDEKTMTIKMRLGSFTKKFEKPEDVNYPPELEEEQ